MVSLSLFTRPHHLALVDVEWFEEGGLGCEQALQGGIVLPQALYE